MAHNERQRRAKRASELTPEEQAAGSDDAEAQAGALLAESEAREAHSRDEAAPVEHRSSDGTDR